MNQEMHEFFTIKNIVFLIAIILFLIFLSKIINIAMLFFGGFVISATLTPIIDKCEKYMPRMLATALVCLLGIFAILVILIPLVVLTAKEGVRFIEDIPNLIIGFETSLKGVKIMGIDVLKAINFEQLLDVSSIFTSKILTEGFHLTKIIANGITSTIAVSIIVFYFCYDKANILARFADLFPEKFKEKATYILQSITEKVGSFVFAQIIAMLFVGVATTIGLYFIGNKHSVLLGFIAFALDIVPAIGPTLAGAIGVLMTAKLGIIPVILAILVYIIVQLLENQILRPYVFAKFMDMHPLMIILSLLIGAKFLGFWGVVLGPPIACVAVVLIDELYIHAMNKTDVKKEQKNS